MRKPRNEHMSSGVPSIADIARRGWHGRKVPTTDSCSAANRLAILLDYLVGAGEQGRRHGEAEQPGGLEIDH
jgi:hypothetical protein